MSCLGKRNEDRALRCEVEGSSVSSFRRFAEVFASTALGFVASLTFSSEGVAIGGWLRALLSGVGPVDNWGANSKLLRGLLRIGAGRAGGCASAGIGANVRPKSTSLT